MKLTGVTYFNQNDPQWKNTKLGTSTVSTIGGYGCLLCDVASICTYYGKDTNPLRLNTDLVAKKGFYNGSYLIYGAVSDIYPDITVDWSNYIDCSTVGDVVPLDKIDKVLESRRPVIVKVDYAPQTTGLQEHWVTIIGKTEDGSYLIMDPIDGSEQFFQARYGDPARYIFKIVVYNGVPKNVTTDADTISELQTKIQTLNEQVATLSLENNTLRTDLAQTENDEKNALEELNKARTEKSALSWEKEQLAIKVKTLEEQVASLTTQKTELQQQVELLKKEAVSVLTKWDLLKLTIDAFFKGGGNHG